MSKKYSLEMAQVTIKLLICESFKPQNHTFKPIYSELFNLIFTFYPTLTCYNNHLLYSVAEVPHKNGYS